MWIIYICEIGKNNFFVVWYDVYSLKKIIKETKKNNKRKTIFEDEWMRRRRKINNTFN